MKQNEAKKRVTTMLKEGKSLDQIIQILCSLQEWEAYAHAKSLKSQRDERREALKQLEQELIQIKGSLYGLAGFGLPDGPLRQLKQSITDCISQAWRLKEGGGEMKRRPPHELIEDAENYLALASMDIPAGDNLTELIVILERLTRLKYRMEGLNELQINAIMRR